MTKPPSSTPEELQGEDSPGLGPNRREQALSGGGSETRAGSSEGGSAYGDDREDPGASQTAGGLRADAAGAAAGAELSDEDRSFASPDGQEGGADARQSTEAVSNTGEPRPVKNREGVEGHANRDPRFDGTPELGETLANFGERRTLDVVEDDERLATVEAELANLHDMIVLDRRRKTRLVDQHGKVRFVLRQVAVGALDRDQRRVTSIRSSCEVDGRHAARRELDEQLVAAALAERRLVAWDRHLPSS